MSLPLLAPLIDLRIVRLTLLAVNKDGEIVPPRTKKNSPVLIRGMSHPMLQPSDEYKEWLRAIQRSLIAAKICAKRPKPTRDPNLTEDAWKRLLRENARLQWLTAPAINYPVGCEALIYREARIGDATGYYDAIGDALEACGIVSNDRWIRHWDGSRMLKDPRRPRVEITLTEVGDDE